MFCYIVLLILGTATPAFAYTDPGSGLLFWQMLVSAIAGGMFYFRKFIKDLSNKIFKKKK